MPKKNCLLRPGRGGIESLERRLLLTAVGLLNDQDIGSPSPAGSASYSNGTYVISGGGTDIAGTSDQFNFASRAITGDTMVVARINSLSNTDPNAKAGVMIRADTTAGSMFASTFVTPQANVVFEWRSAASGSAASATVSAISAPIWLKITEQGNSFTASWSADDTQWNAVGSSQAITMPSAMALAGLAVTSHNSAALNTASFSAVSMTPSKFTAGDVGSPSLLGSSIYDAPSDTYTLMGNGADIYGTADQFQFAWTNMSGDGSAVAYVDSITNTDPWAKAGVMMRTDTSAASAFAGLFVSAQNGIVFEWRSLAGGSVQQEVSSPAGGPTTTPVSLKLTRGDKNSFAAYYSTDGVNWILVGPAQTVVMPSQLDAGLAVCSHNAAALCTATFSSVGIGGTVQPAAGVYSASDQQFLDDLEMRETEYFYDETNPNTGLVPDNANANGGSPSGYSSIAAIGFGLTGLTIADARGWLSHSAAYQRVLTTLNFLYNTGASFNGFFYHFLDPNTGARSPGSELSSVDTAELMAGVLDAGQYWPGTQVAAVANNLYNRVNWPWMQQSSGIFYGAWTPESGFSGGYGDFSEAVVLYLLALGSTTHPVPQSSWTAWSRSPAETYAGYHFITADDAALFTVQYPMAWFDLRGLSDSTGLNYYQNAQNATLAQRQWMSDISTQNSKYRYYSLNLWGLTPSESASGYTVWGGPPAYGPIDGTVVPTGPGGSLEFTPQQSLSSLEYMKKTFGSAVYQKYGLIDSFDPAAGWASSLVLGIDAGMMLVSAENARSNLVWNVFNQNPTARQAMALAFPSIAPQLLSAVSRKVASNSFEYDQPINLAGALSVENRQGGPTQLVLTFEANIVKGPNFAVTVTNASGGADGSVIGSAANGPTLTINLSGVADAQTLVVNITDVRHFSTSASANFTLNLGVLLADANQDGATNALDFNALAANYGGAGKTSAQGDFNFDGTVNSIDFDLLASEYGKTLAVSAAAPASLLPASVSPGDLFAASSNQPLRLVTLFNDSSLGLLD